MLEERLVSLLNTKRYKPESASPNVLMFDLRNDGGKLVVLGEGVEDA